MFTINPETIKRESEAIILKAGGQICDWLPYLDANTKPRDLNSVARRALILHAMLQIAFKAPVLIIKDWIANNGLAGDLSKSERELLDKDNRDLSDQELLTLYWYMEALWALVWAGSLVDDLPFDECVRDSLASLCPNLQRNEDGAKFANSLRLRSGSWTRIATGIPLI